MQPLTPLVHPAAIIEEGALLGDGVSIGPYSIIEEHAKIGDGSKIGSHVVIEGWTTVGRDCSVGHGSVLGSAPQDKKYRNKKSYVVIGDRNTIREFVTVNSATDEGEKTIIGDDNLLMAYVHVAHNCVIGNHVILANAVNLGGHITIDDYACVGGMTPVHQFVHIGKHAFIGGASRVAMDVAPFVRAAGNPLRASGLNTVGLVRRGFSAEKRAELKRIYRIFFRSGLTAKESIEQLGKEFPASPEAQEFIQFVLKSERGMTR
ncbi:MAG: acyl-ACP--UDP-N-acetylglucosamine O-acyltransferase [Candidatus Eisenbacteria bacterium]|nr:acyl-ACP--UDP-N-acetylglucosamine O-acyltransferase [Candidatus Eisenbacteria bacterium]